MTLKQECLWYFKERKGYDRLFNAVWEKLKVLGKIGGNVVLDKLTSEERECLERFFRKTFDKENCSIRIIDISRAFSLTKFGGIDFIEFLEGYFQEKLVSNRFTRKKFFDLREEFFNAITEEFKGTDAYSWLCAVFSLKKFGYQIIVRQYSEQYSDALKNIIGLVARGINHLPMKQNKFLRIGVFATDISKDPHFFDRGTFSGGLFLQGLEFTLNMETPTDAEEVSELYYLAGIVSDKISSFTVAKGVRLFNEKEEHAAFKGFNNLNEDFIVTLSNLDTIKKARAIGNKVFVVENPNAFSAICDILKEEEFSLVCTNGQLKLASLILLDMLVCGGCEIYYSGDFDGGGLLIAERLKNRYGGKLVFWHFGVDDYLENISDVDINDIGIKKIQSIKSLELMDLVSEMTLKKKAAFQEMMVDELSLDIRDFLKKDKTALN